MLNIGLQTADYVFFATLLGLFILAEGLAWVFLGGSKVPVVLGLMFTLTSLAQVLLFRQSSRRRYDDYRQLESLFTLFSTLRPQAPLPPFRGWAVSPDFATVLTDLIQRKRPETILELGSGVSTLVAAYSLKALGRGRVVSLEHDAEFADKVRADILFHGLESWAAVIHAPLRDVTACGQKWKWYDTSFLASFQAIDLLIVDGPPGRIGHMARYPALPILRGQLSEGSVILLDDSSRSDERRMIKLWLERFGGFASEERATEKGTTILIRLNTEPSDVRGMS